MNLLRYIYVINYLTLFTDADFSVPSTCTIFSTSLSTLTTDGGVIFNGTQNVIIYCLCMKIDVIRPGVRWFFPDNTQVRTETNLATGPNDPYFRNIVPTPLIIREFVHPYNGTYSCGPSTDFGRVLLEGDTISLILASMINFVTVWCTLSHIL